MAKKVEENSGGVTKQSQFRLGERALAQLDDLVAAAGEMETRSSAIRRLIAEAHGRMIEAKKGRGGKRS